MAEPLSLAVFPGVAAVLLVWLTDGTQLRRDVPGDIACGDEILRLLDQVRAIDPGADLICEPVEAGPPARSPRPRPRP